MTAVPNPPHHSFPRRFVRAVLTVGALVLAATAAIVLSPGADTTIAAVGDPLGAGGEFHKVTPTRIQDSRNPALDIASRKGKKPTGPNRDSVQFDVPFLGGASPLPADGVLAVVANITVVQPSQDGYLTAYPKGSSPGVSSVANFKAGQNVANSTILRPGADGKVTFHLNTPAGSGQAHFLVDITGWFSTSSYATRGARVVPVNPVRAYDSGKNRLVGATKVDLQITGQHGIPKEDVVGVIVNITGVNAFGGSKRTYLSVVPDNFSVADRKAWPKTSNLNLGVGQTRANLAVMPVGADGKIHLFSAGGEVRAVVDITGYLLANQPGDTTAGRVIPLETAFRSLDTRQPAFDDQPLGPAMAEDFSFKAFAGDVRIGSEHVGPQSGLFGNLTAVGLQPSPSWQTDERSHLTVYPSPKSGGSKTPPTISNLNITQGEAVPNMALLRYGSDTRIRFFNFDGYVDYILDVYAVVLE
jgi:hypothetical protein